MNADFSIAGFQPASGATIYSYGIPQDEAARPRAVSPDLAQTKVYSFGILLDEPAPAGTVSPDLEETDFTGASAEFSRTFPPYSATVMVLSPLRVK